MTSPDTCPKCGHTKRDHVGRYSTGRPLCIVCGCRVNPWRDAGALEPSATRDG